MTLTLIAAVAENNALGKDNQMLWHLPDDFKRFKQLTSGHYIIMGRKTFESLPGMLPNRKHVIITRQQDYKAEGCIIVNSLDEALAASPQDEEVFIIGGGEIYKQAIGRANKLELTRVHSVAPEADAFFPDFDENVWKLTEEVFHPKDEKHRFDFTFETYLHKNHV
jgi:dihydrofolate reductase